MACCQVVHLKISSTKWQPLCPGLNMLNTLRLRQNGHGFADDIFKRIFLNENVRISIKISLKFVPKGPTINIPALVQIMAWRRSGDKPLSEQTLVSLLTHICVTRPQWVNSLTAHSGIQHEKYNQILYCIVAKSSLLRLNLLLIHWSK